MGRRRLTIAAAGAILAAAAGMLAPPARYAVDGLSMAPGLLPGDAVVTGPLPALDLLRRPARHARWIVAAPDGTPALKRVVGLPGETVTIRDGDLAIDGAPVVASPAVLAQTASAVILFGAAVASPPSPSGRGQGEGAPAISGDWVWSLRPPEILDDAPFAPTERRLLVPVRDVGLAAVIQVPATISAATIRVAAGVDSFVTTWRVGAAGRFAIVAGRLDGRLVGAAWPLGGSRREAGRSCLPPDAPGAWDISMPWAASGTSHDAAPEQLALGITVDGRPVESDLAAAMLEACVVWRDQLLRPAADGVVEWRLGPAEYFLLGDFPSGSRDCRHWGPLARPSLSHPVWPAFAPP